MRVKHFTSKDKPRLMKSCLNLGVWDKILLCVLEYGLTFLPEFNWETLQN